MPNVCRRQNWGWAASLLLAAAAVAAPLPPVRGTLRAPSVSGAAALPGGRLLLTTSGPDVAWLLDDAPRRLVGGSLDVKAEARIAGLTEKNGLEDVEGAAWDGARAVYLLGSHAREPRGEPPPARYRMGRLTLDADGRVTGWKSTEALGTALFERYPFLADAARRTPAKAGVNLEGMSWGPEGHLYLGFRAPTVTTFREQGGNEDAVVLALKNPATLFADPPEPPMLDEPVIWNLEGQGIRDMVWDDERKQLWVLAGLSVEPNHPVRSPWALWRWDGKVAPQRVPLPAAEVERLADPSALALVTTPEGVRLLIVDRAREAAPYLLLERP